MWLKSLVNLILLSGLAIILFACSNAAEEVQAPTKSAPQNVTATSKSEEVVVQWDPVPNAEYYVVCWAYVPITSCEPGNSKVVYKELTDVTNWSHNNITNDTSYHYVVLAFVGTGFTELSVDVNGLPRGIRPPTIVNISSNENTATIGWTNVDGASGYDLYMSSIPNVTKINYVDDTVWGKKFADISNPFTVTDLAVNGTPYYFVLTAKNDLGNGVILESAESSEVIAIPKLSNPADAGYLPTDFTVESGYSNVNGAGNQIDEYFQVSMSNPCPYPNSNIFTVYWSQTPFGNTKPYICDPNNEVECKSDAFDFALTDRTNVLTPGTYYYFTVMTTYSDLCTLPSTGVTPIETELSANVAIKTPGTSVPSVPVITATVDGLVNAVKINVENPDANLSYNLYMVAQNFFDDGNIELTVVNHTNDKIWGMKHANIPTTFTHVALPNGKPFYFIVTSVNSNGNESAASAMVSATPLAP